MLGLVTKIWKNNTDWLEKKQNTILSAAIIITIANIASSLSGLIRQRLLISYFFGSDASKLSFDAFLFAFQIPDMMFQLIIIGALSAAFIPIFGRYKKIDEAAAFKMSSILMNSLLLIFMIIGGLVFYFAPQITHARAGSQFSPEQIAITILLTRIMIGAQFFFAISNFFSGILQSYHRFIIPSIAPVLYNLGILIGVFMFYHQLGIYSAGVGVIIGAFLHMIIQLPSVLKLGFKYTPSLNIKFPGVGEFYALMPPRVLALSIGELRDLALGFFATSIGGISFTIVQLGLMLMTIPIRFFGVPIGQASLPFLSEEATEENRARYIDLVLQSLHQIAFFTYPTSILLLILRIPTVRLAFGAANFPWPTTTLVGKVVAILALSIGAQAMTQLLIRAFYAIKDTKTPLIVSAFDMLLYVGIASYLVFKTDLGVLGIATATMFSAVIEFLLLIVLLNHKVHGFMGRSFWIPQLKMIVASFFMAVFIYLPYKVFDQLVFNTTKTIELIGLTITTGTIGMLVYIGFAYLLNVRELRIFVKLFHAFEGWRTLTRSREMIAESPIEGDEV